MFQFPTSSSHTLCIHVCVPEHLPQVGSPIRTSTGRWLFAPYRSFSQLIASFFAFWCLGIHPMLLIAWPTIFASQNIVPMFASQKFNHFCVNKYRSDTCFTLIIVFLHQHCYLCKILFLESILLCKKQMYNILLCKNCISQFFDIFSPSELSFYHLNEFYPKSH